MYSDAPPAPPGPAYADWRPFPGGTAASIFPEVVVVNEIDGTYEAYADEAAADAAALAVDVDEVESTSGPDVFEAITDHCEEESQAGRVAYPDPATFYAQVEGEIAAAVRAIFDDAETTAEDWAAYVPGARAGAPAPAASVARDVSTLRSILSTTRENVGRRLSWR